MERKKISKKRVLMIIFTIAVFLNLFRINNIEINNTRLRSNIAIIDSGASKDIISKNPLVSGYNAITHTNDVIDENGHGTMMLNTLINENFGYALSSNILVIKAFDKDGESDATIIANALRYACENDADIVNMSFSLNKSNKLLEESVNYCKEKDVTMVASVGNEVSSKAYYPAKYEDVISVSRLDESSVADIQVDMNEAIACVNNECINNTTNSLATIIASGYIAQEFMKRNVSIINEIKDSKFRLTAKYRVEQVKK